MCVLSVPYFSIILIILLTDSIITGPLLAPYQMKTPFLLQGIMLDSALALHVHINDCVAYPLHLLWVLPCDQVPTKMLQGTGGLKIRNEVFETIPKISDTTFFLYENCSVVAQ